MAELTTRSLPQAMPDAPGYHFVTVAADEQRFLRAAFDALGCETLKVWTERSVFAEDFDRVAAGGLVTALGVWQGRRIALAWSDFRIGGASLGKDTSRRFVAFLRELERLDDDVPLIYLVNSAGVSLMEGRAVFSDAFQLLPALLAFAERHLLLTCASGKCLGLAAILFSLGHYRVAVGGRTELNLTGPEVIKLFFGSGVDFAAQAAAERSHERTEVVHEIAPSLAAALAQLLAIAARRPAEPADLPAAPRGTRTAALLAAFLDGPPRELVPGWCPRVRLFLGTRAGRPIGVFINPPERSNNMITVRTLQKYSAGLDLFAALRVPALSLLDAPGIDPRFEQADANLLRTVAEVGAKIVRYPWGTMGIVIGRCFGGATTLGFPRVFGSRRTVALRSSRIGTMHPSIITRVLAGSPRLLEQWQACAALQARGFDDLLADGTLDAVVDEGDLGAEVDRFLGPHLCLVRGSAR